MRMSRAARELASHDLDDYMRQRAVAETVLYGLSPSFFDEALKAGCRYAFGITVSDSGELISDDQEPYQGFLHEWKNN